MKDQNGTKSATRNQMNVFLDDNGHYREKPKDEQAEFFNYVFDLWDDFLIAQGETNLIINKDYFVHKRNLFEAIKRLDKRKTYYYVFHKITKICEYKEIAILCYWINTLKPFMVVNENSKIYSCPNEMFSLYIIMSILARIYEHYYPNKQFKFPEAKVIQDYVYNFKYCDLSREATIFFVETLAKTYNVGMDVLDPKESDNYT